MFAYSLIPVLALSWAQVDTIHNSFEWPEWPLADWETEIY